jgi:hypothetical protein
MEGEDSMATLCRTISALFLLNAALPTTQGDPPVLANAGAILERAVRAHGGEETLLRTKRIATRTKGKLFKEGRAVSYTAVRRSEMPNRVRLDLFFETDSPKKHTVIVLNGDQGWKKEGSDGAIRLDEREIVQIRRGIYHERVTRLFGLSNKEEFSLKALEERVMDGKSLVGISVQAKGQQPMELYFDRQNGLLTRAVMGKGEDGRVYEEQYLAYKDFNGLKFPTRWIGYGGKEKIREVQLIEIQFHSEDDATAFGKP